MSLLVDIRGGFGCCQFSSCQIGSTQQHLLKSVADRAWKTAQKRDIALSGGPLHAYQKTPVSIDPV
jgi:hypothetical protein